jgi:hypothetical protein
LTFSFLTFLETAGLFFVGVEFAAIAFSVLIGFDLVLSKYAEAVVAVNFGDAGSLNYLSTLGDFRYMIRYLTASLLPSSWE